MRESKGFTLIELLVVIAVIALLLAMLMPALGRAMELGQRAELGQKIKLSLYHRADDILALLRCTEKCISEPISGYASQKMTLTSLSDKATAQASNSFGFCLYLWLVVLECAKRCKLEIEKRIKEGHKPPDEWTQFKKAVKKYARDLKDVMQVYKKKGKEAAQRKAKKLEIDKQISELDKLLKVLLDWLNGLYGFTLE